MPDPAEILAELTAIANAALAVAVIWHFLIAGALLALVRGWRPQADVAATLLASLPGSVAVLAIAQESWFNGLTFSTITIALLFLSTRLGWAPVGGAARSYRLVGVALVGFGYFYPHFLGSMSPLVYLVAAPVGVVPCPTLAVLVGFTLLEGQRFSRTWGVIVAVAALFYGAFGALRLGVWLDLPLIAGAAVLFSALVRIPHSRPAMTAGLRA